MDFISTSFAIGNGKMQDTPPFPVPFRLLCR